MEQLLSNGMVFWSAMPMSTWMEHGQECTKVRDFHFHAPPSCEPWDTLKKNTSRYSFGKSSKNSLCIMPNNTSRNVVMSEVLFSFSKCHSKQHLLWHFEKRKQYIDHLDISRGIVRDHTEWKFWQSSKTIPRGIVFWGILRVHKKWPHFSSKN